MKHLSDYPTRVHSGYIPALTLAAGAIIGLLTMTGLYLSSTKTTPTSTAIWIESDQTAIVVGNDFTVTLVVTANQVVNAFTGILHFDESKLAVEKIDYNTSIADLWAKEPWYNKGEGTISFAGGSTKPGGFSGEGTLLTITFTAQQTGQAIVSLDNAQVLAHDGRGTAIPLPSDIEALFTISNTASTTAIVTENNMTIDVAVMSSLPSPDLNGSGTTTLVDVSIFMLYLAEGNTQGDFNLDNKVNLTDLSILLDAQGG